MPSGYPAAIDNFNNPTNVDNLNTAAVIHTAQHTNVNDAVKAIQTELGLLPKGTALSVKDRLVAIEASLASKAIAAQKGQASGYASLDAASKLVETLDSTKITSGLLNLARLPSIPGTKILGTVGGGAAIPVDAVPALDAGKTTTGVFPTARIPGLPATWINSGILDAARLPSSVTSNANSRVVADVAAMNAIPLGERVDGMLVTVRSPTGLHVWRSDNSTWNQQGSGPLSLPLQVEDQTDYLALTNTGFSPGTTLGIIFVAPASGKAFITVTGHLESNTANGIAYLSFEVKTGNAMGAGTAQYGPSNEDAFAVGSAATLTRGRGSSRALVEGLAPGASYNVRCVHLCTTGNFDIFARRLAVELVQ